MDVKFKQEPNALIDKSRQPVTGICHVDARIVKINTPKQTPFPVGGIYHSISEMQGIRNRKFRGPNGKDINQRDNKFRVNYTKIDHNNFPTLNNSLTPMSGSNKMPNESRVPPSDSKSYGSQTSNKKSFSNKMTDHPLLPPNKTEPSKDPRKAPTNQSLQDINKQTSPGRNDSNHQREEDQKDSIDSASKRAASTNHNEKIKEQPSNTVSIRYHLDTFKQKISHEIDYKEPFTAKVSYLYSSEVNLYVV